ncbi:hypothetical protein PENTCL1PPCAC_1360, partial [Pristionchus entomophagus]
FISAMKGLRVGGVQINSVESVKDARKVEELLSLWKFTSLTVLVEKLIDWKCDFILSVLRKYHIQVLQIDVTKCQLRDPSCRLLQLADQVRSLVVTQRRNYEKQRGANYLFGLE